MGEFNKHDLFQTFCDALGIKTKRDLKYTAYHEAGHAVANILHPCFFELKSATLIAKNGAAGTTHRKPKEEPDIKTETTLKNEILMLLAGHAAATHRNVRKDRTTGLESDFIEADGVAHLMIKTYGFPKDIQDPAEQSSINTSPLNQIFGISNPFSNTMDDRVDAIIEKETKNARIFVTENWDAIDRVAQALLVHKTLQADEIEKLVYQDQLKPDITLG